MPLCLKAPVTMRDYCPLVPRYGGDTPRYGRDTPRYGRDTLRYDRDTPRYDRDTPRYDRDTPRYDRDTPRYGRDTPRLRAPRTVRFPNDVVFQDHIKQGDLEQVGRFIRARKVTLDTIYPSGMAALHEAVLTGNLDCVKLLVKHGADIHQRDENGWTPLHMACSDGHADIARYLLSLGASLEATTDDGEKPRDLIEPEYEELVQLLGGAALR